MLHNNLKQESNEMVNLFLCSNCQTLGYCRKKIAENELQKPALEREISHWVPKSARKNNGSKHFFTKIQQAHDLFHQEEYEGASYLYRDLYETRNDSTEVLVGLAASLYFLNRYEEAASITLTLLSNYNQLPEKFINLCLLKVKEKQELEQALIKESIEKAQQSSNGEVTQEGLITFYSPRSLSSKTKYSCASQAH